MLLHLRFLKLMKKQTIFLIYSTIDNKKVIDAITGNPISLNYYGDYTTLDAEEVGAAGDAEKRAITPEERKEIRKTIRY